MHILTINHEYPPLGGGGGAAHKELIDEWIAEHDVHLVTSRFRELPPSEMHGRLRMARVHTLRTKQATTHGLALLLFPLMAMWQLWKYRREDYDVCNAQFAVPAGIAGVYAKRLFGIPLVVSIHGGDIYDPSKRFSPHRWALTRAVVRWVLRSADAIIAQSQNTVENAKRLYGIDTRIHILPLPYSLHALQPRKKNNTYTYVGLGRLVKRKAFDDLIAAFATVHAHFPATRLVIIGEGPERAHLEACIANHRVTESVTLMGRVSEEEKFRILQESHCFVLSSLHEGYGVMLQEAIECELPIVSTNHGGQTDFLRNEQNALLVDPQNPAQLAQAMARYYRDANLARKMSLASLQALRIFNPNVIAQTYITIFQNLCVRHS